MSQVHRAPPLTNFFMSQNFRRPNADLRKGPETLSDAEFHADFISEVRLVVSLDAEELWTCTSTVWRLTML